MTRFNIHEIEQLIKKNEAWIKDGNLGHVTKKVMEQNVDVLRVAIEQVQIAEKVVETARNHTACKNANAVVYGGDCVCNGCRLALALKEHDDVSA